MTNPSPAVEMSRRVVHVLHSGTFRRVAFTAWRGGAPRRAAICLHGHMEDGRELDPLARALAEEGWLVLCPDLAGHGLSDWCASADDYRFATYAADVSHLMAVAGSRRVDLIGLSMGGFVAMRLGSIAKAPIRSLVLGDAGAVRDPDAMRRVLGIAPTRAVYPDAASAAAALRLFASDRGPLPEDHWEELLRLRLVRTPDGVRFRFDPRLVQLAGEGTARALDRWHVWNAIRAPTLLIRGERSHMLTAEHADEMVRSRPGAELLTLPGVGHPPWLRTPDQIAPIVAWLKQLPD